MHLSYKVIAAVPAFCHNIQKLNSRYEQTYYISVFVSLVAVNYGVFNKIYCIAFYCKASNSSSSSKFFHSEQLVVCRFELQLYHVMAI